MLAWCHDNALSSFLYLYFAVSGMTLAWVSYTSCAIKVASYYVQIRVNCEIHVSMTCLSVETPLSVLRLCISMWPPTSKLLLRRCGMLVLASNLPESSLLIILEITLATRLDILRATPVQTARQVMIPVQSFLLACSRTCDIRRNGLFTGICSQAP